MWRNEQRASESEHGLRKREEIGGVSRCALELERHRHGARPQQSKDNKAVILGEHSFGRYSCFEYYSFHIPARLIPRIIAG